MKKMLSALLLTLSLSMTACATDDVDVDVAAPAVPTAADFAAPEDGTASEAAAARPTSVCREEYEQCLSQVGGDGSLECQCLNNYLHCSHRPEQECQPPG